MTTASIYALPAFSSSMQNALQALAINNEGEVVGYAESDTGSNAASWVNRTVTDLGALPGDGFSNANGVNDAGQVVGYSSAGPFNLSHAALWQNGTVTEISAAQDFGQANAINNSGQVVGVGGAAGAVAAPSSGRTAP